MIVIKIIATIAEVMLLLVSILSLVGGRPNDAEFRVISGLVMVTILALAAIWC